MFLAARPVTSAGLLVPAADPAATALGAGHPAPSLGVQLKTPTPPERSSDAPPTLSFCHAGARPICSRPRAPLRIAATAAPAHTAAAADATGNGAQARSSPVVITEPVTLAGPVQIQGVLSPAAVYMAVSCC